MKKASAVLASLTLLAAAISTAHAEQSLDTLMAADSVQQDIHFLDGKGNIVRGKRCAHADPTADEQARIETDLNRTPGDADFGMKALGGLGGVAFMAQLIGTLMGIGIAVAGSFIVYGTLKKFVGLRLDAEEEFNGADLSIHKISATAERETLW